jgi:hypothetical protein
MKLAKPPAWQPAQTVTFVVRFIGRTWKGMNRRKQPGDNQRDESIRTDQRKRFLKQLHAAYVELEPHERTSVEYHDNPQRDRHGAPKHTLPSLRKAADLMSVVASTYGLFTVTEAIAAALLPRDLDNIITHNLLAPYDPRIRSPIRGKVERDPALAVPISQYLEEAHQLSKTGVRGNFSKPCRGKLLY